MALFLACVQKGEGAPREFPVLTVVGDSEGGADNDIVLLSSRLLPHSDIGAPAPAPSSGLVLKTVQIQDYRIFYLFLTIFLVSNVIIKLNY